jgi:uncharacterized protein
MRFSEGAILPDSPGVSKEIAATPVIIDVHVHLVGISPTNGCFLSTKGSRRFFRGLQKYALRLAHLDRAGFDRLARRRLHRRVTASGVDAVGLLALDGAYDTSGVMDQRATGLYVSNDYLFEVAGDSPRYLPIASVNPARRDAADELERVAALGAVAIKVLPNTQNFDPASRAFVPFWQRMAALRLPLLAHTGIEFTLPEHETVYGAPERLRPALDQGLTIIAAHCGTAGGRGLTEHLGQWLALLAEYPNLYGDLAALVSPARLPFLSRVLSDPLARQRLVLGSDYPVPVTPILASRALGLRTAWRLQRVRNPIRRNLLALRAMGMDSETETQAARLLRLPERYHPAGARGG